MALRRLLQVLAAAVFVLGPVTAWAQDQADPQPPSERQAEPSELSPAENAIAGEFTPSKGFDLLKTSWGSLNLSMYGLVRYVNQLPGEQTFVDHLGREHTVKARNDINWHRTMIWLSGFALDERLMYIITLWSLPTVQQTLGFGNLMFRFHKAFTLGAGISPNLTARSMGGSHPYWASSDRLMGEEFFRGGFSSGIWAKGEPIPRLFYTVSVNTNLSQLGITATNDTRELAYSASIWWMPTTGEFGQRGGVADFEQHSELATRFGLSAGHAREYRGAALGLPPNETQLRFSDGLYVFEEGALAEGLTLTKATYQDLTLDAAFKYRGFSLMGEYFLRRLSNFVGDGPVPVDHVFDHGFTVQAMHMVWPKRLGVYASTSMVFDDFERFPWEVVGGLAAYPFQARSFRLNLHVIYVHQSPTGSNFGFYSSGQTGPTISLGADVLL